MNIALFYHRIFIEVLINTGSWQNRRLQIRFYIMYPPCESGGENDNIKRRENKQPRLKNKWLPPNQGNPLAPRGRPAVWRADCRPGVWSLLEIITIKQISISFLSPTMSELRTFGPRPKIPSPQAQPALNQANSSVSKSRSFSRSGHCFLAVASSGHHCLHLPHLFPFFPYPRMGPRPSLSFFTWCVREELLDEGWMLLSFQPHLGPFQKPSYSLVFQEGQILSLPSDFISKVVHGNYWREGPWQLQPNWQDSCLSGQCHLFSLRQEVSAKAKGIKPSSQAGPSGVTVESWALQLFRLGFASQFSCIQCVGSFSMRWLNEWVRKRRMVRMWCRWGCREGRNAQ